MKPFLGLEVSQLHFMALISVVITTNNVVFMQLKCVLYYTKRE